MQAIRNMEPAWEKIHGSKFRLMFREVNIGNGAVRHDPCVYTKQNTLFQCKYLRFFTLFQCKNGVKITLFQDFYLHKMLSYEKNFVPLYHINVALCHGTVPCQMSRRKIIQ